MLRMLMILKVLREFKMKFYQMKITDVVRSTAFEIAEVELSEIAEYVDAVFRFVVPVASIVYLINFHFDVVASAVVSIAEIADVSIAEIADASIVVKQMNVSAFALKIMKMIICWFDEIVFNFDAEKFLISNRFFLFSVLLLSNQLINRYKSLNASFFFW